MRIRALAAQLGVSPDWIRRLERIGRLPLASRDLNDHRRYGAADLAAIRAALFPPGGQDQNRGDHT